MLANTETPVTRPCTCAERDYGLCPPCLATYKVTEMGTDSGPACRRCESTLWLYKVTTEAAPHPFTEVTATCAACKRTTYFHSRHLLTDVASVRARHCDLAVAGARGVN